MITNSNIKPIEKVIIESINDSSNLCSVYLIDLDSIVENTKQQENAKDQIFYTYNSYREKIKYRPNLKSHIENKFDIWLAWAKEQEKQRNTIKKSPEEILQEIQEQQLDNIEMNIDQEARISILEMGIEGDE